MTSSLSPSDLETRFQQPAHFQWNSFERLPGRTIRYGYNIPDGIKPRAIVVDLPGLNDPIEKQFEAYRQLEERGIAVFTMEWMGQGGSARYLGDQRRHSDNFENDIKDFLHFMDHIVLPHLSKINAMDAPRILKAHSMGGHLALRSLSRLKNTFNKAVISAPMVEIGSLPIPKPMRLCTANFLRKTLGGEKYAPFSGDLNLSNPKRLVGTDEYSSDPARSVLHNVWMAQNPVGGVTNQWVYDAHVSIRKLRQEFAAIKTPTFVGVASNDHVVDPQATLDLCKGSQAVKAHLINGARHEIWNEADEYRNILMDQLLHLDI